MSTIHETIQQLGSAFEAFKSENNRRLQQVESKKSVDPLVDEKLRKIDDAIQTLEQKHLELSRPHMSATKAELKYSSAEAKAFQQYLRAGDEHGLRTETKALSRGAAEDGGYLVPDNLGDMVRVNTENLSVMRRIAQVMTVSSDHVDMLIDRGDFGSGWVAETDARAETATSQLQKQKISVHEMYAKPRATQKLLDDAHIDVENWIATKISERFAKLESHGFILGDGANKPTGFLTYEHVGAAALAWGRLQTFASGRDGQLAALNPADQLIELVYSLKPQYHDKAVWLLSRSALQEIRRLKDAHGHYIWQPSLQEGQPSHLLGYPVYIDEQMPPLVTGTAGVSIAFGDFSAGYQILERAGLRILRDPYSAKPFVEFYATKRVGGDVVNFDAIKLLACRA